MTKKGRTGATNTVRKPRTRRIAGARILPRFRIVFIDGRVNKYFVNVLPYQVYLARSSLIV